MKSCLRKHNSYNFSETFITIHRVIFATVLGDSCTDDTECADLTDSECDKTCKCKSGFIQDGTGCKKGKFKIIVLF